MTRFLAASLLCLCPLVRADFPSFRGGSGVAVKAQMPADWGNDKNIAWKAQIPGGGWSQPIVMGDKLFVATAVCDPPMIPSGMADGVKTLRSIPGVGRFSGPPNVKIQWQVICLDANTGKPLWTSTAAEGKPKQTLHPSNTYATETLVADAERVYAYFGAAGIVAAFDHAGKQIWKQDVGVFRMMEGFGHGSSPALVDGILVAQVFSEEKSFLVAFDAKSGQQKWRVDRDKPGSSWATPYVWKNKQRTEVVSFGAELVTSHDPQTGKEFWRLANVDGAVTASATADDERLYFGNSGPMSIGPLYAVKAGGAGDISPKRGELKSDFLVWTVRGAGPGMSSPVVHDGLLYVINSVGLSCYDAGTGQRVWRQRLAEVKYPCASLLIADGKLLVIDEAGTALVLQAGREYKLLATNVLDDTIWASPAISGKSLYLRGVKAMYCVRP